MNRMNKPGTERSLQGKRKRTLIWVGALVLLICGILPFPIYREFIFHDLTLYRQVRSFEQLQHPPGTSQVVRRTFIGLYLGNGNHCDYFVGGLRRYSGDRQVIEAFYADQLVEGSGIGIAFVENGDFPEQAQLWSLPPGLQHLSAWLDPSTVSADHLYLIYSFDIDLDPGLDIRCS